VREAYSHRQQPRLAVYVIELQMEPLHTGHEEAVREQHLDGGGAGDNDTVALGAASKRQVSRSSGPATTCDLRPMLSSRAREFGFGGIRT
jgi:hypothetical protein